VRLLFRTERIVVPSCRGATIPFPAACRRAECNLVVKNKEKKEGRERAYLERNSSFAIRSATTLQQAGLEQHQSSVKSSPELRVLPRSVQRAKLQGSADFNVFDEATRSYR
jgi:hypothetical protein